MPRADSPFFEAATFNDADRRAQAQLLHDDGYVVLRSVFDAELLAAARDETSSLFRPELGDGHRSAYRCQDAWVESAATRSIATAPPVIDLLADLYGRRPFPFQTLTFRTGSQQRAHSDTLHFNSIPARFMGAAWVALEDIEPDSGPLFYYPGSHRLPELRSFEIGSHPVEVDYPTYEDAIETMMAANGIEPVTLEATAGDVFIWSANLVHGGHPIADPTTTRWSQVTHYYFDGCVYYAPRYSDPLQGTLALRDVVDVTTGHPVAHRVGAHEVRTEPVDELRHRVWIDEWYPPTGARRELEALARQGRRATAALGRAARRRLTDRSGSQRG